MTCRYCDKPVHAQERCAAHYIAARRSGSVVTAPRTKLQHSDFKVDMSGPRCRCGLRLPCNDCLPSTATEYAFTRMYAPEAT